MSLFGWRTSVITNSMPQVNNTQLSNLTQKYLNGSGWTDAGMILMEELIGKYSNLGWYSNLGGYSDLGRFSYLGRY